MADVTQFMQYDGSSTDGPTTLGVSSYSGGDVWMPSDTRAPGTSIMNSIVLVESYDGTVVNVKSTAGITMDSNGYVPEEVTANYLMDRSTHAGIQTIIVGAGISSVIIDLALGSIIKLSQQANITITFHNVPIGMVTPIVIYRTNVGGGNFTLGFVDSVYMEGRQKLTLSTTANAVDTIYMYTRGNGILYCRTPIINSTKAAGSIGIMSALDVTTAPSGPSSPGTMSITNDTIVTVTAAGNLMSTDIVLQGSTIVTPFYSVNNQAKLIYYTYSSVTASAVSGAVTFNCNNGMFGVLTHDSNITSFNITNMPTTDGAWFTVFRTGANTSLTLGPDYRYDTAPTLTANSTDILVFSHLSGTAKLVQVFQDFGPSA